MNEKIVTAKELLIRNGYSGIANHTTISKFMVEFAKYHVELALKEASVKAEPYNVDEAGQVIYTDARINKVSILNAYNLDLIE